MEGFTSARICTGRITRTVTPEDSVLLRTLTSSVSISVVISMSGIYRGVRTRVYPGRQARPIRAASTFLVTGMGPGSSGDLARSWVVTQLWLHLYHQFTKRSGRRAPVLERRTNAQRSRSTLRVLFILRRRNYGQRGSRDIAGASPFTVAAPARLLLTTAMSCVRGTGWERVLRLFLRLPVGCARLV